MKKKKKKIGIQNGNQKTYPMPELEYKEDTNRKLKQI